MEYKCMYQSLSNQIFELLQNGPSLLATISILEWIIDLIWIRLKYEYWLLIIHKEKIIGNTCTFLTLTYRHYICKTLNYIHHKFTHFYIECIWLLKRHETARCKSKTCQFFIHFFPLDRIFIMILGIFVYKDSFYMF